MARVASVVMFGELEHSLYEKLPLCGILEMLKVVERSDEPV
jgi:hypothetical protein